MFGGSDHVWNPCLPPWPPPVATLRPLPSPVTGLPRLPEPPFRRAVPTTPADRAGARVDCFPAHAAFPKRQEGRHPHCHFQGLLRLHSRYGPSDCSAALRRPLSRGSSPSGCPAEPLVSYRINRQLSGWNPPPLVIRAFGAHCQQRTFDCTRSNRAWHTQRSVALGYNSGKGSFSSRVVISELKLGNVKRERAPRV